MSKPDFEPIERTLYLGRRRLGRFVQTDKKQFEGFGPDDCSLGLFETSKQVLAAIRDAQSALVESRPGSAQTSHSSKARTSAP
jgi:hypothetical protein